ncbi:MAG: hypothetical protein WCH34_05585 [Bacteroidota bacterium]
MKKQKWLFVIGLVVLFISCSKKIENLDIKKYAEKFKFKHLESFDARTLPPDLNQIDDKALLTNLWQDKDLFMKKKNYFFSLQNGVKGNQEFTIVSGDLENKTEAKQLWYFIYSGEGKQLARFIISESDVASNTYSLGSIKKEGAYDVSNYQKDVLINSKSYSLDEKGNLIEGKVEKAEKDSVSTVVAQEFHVKDVFTQKSIVIAGLDFSRAKFVGKALKDVGEIKNKFFREWNDLMEEEKAKFNFGDFFNKEKVIYDFSGSNNRNSYCSTANMYSKAKVASLSQSSVQSTLYNVSLKEKHGIGSVFVVEAFDDENDQAIVWVTLFDIASKKLLITERLTARPHGGGLRNYWINAVYEILVHVNRVSYAAWKAKYAK